MTRLWRILVAIVAGSMLVPSALGQCPSGIVNVRGKVENLPPGATDVGITVSLKTPKGGFSERAAVTHGQFAVDVEFRTTKFWSFWRHNCSNVPESVTLKVSEGDQKLAVRVLDFKKNFGQVGSHTYVLKEQDFTMDLSNAKP